MYRAILPDGEIRCERYDRGEHGADLYDENDDVLAFVPYPNLVALVHEEAQHDEDRSTW